MPKLLSNKRLCAPVYLGIDPGKSGGICAIEVPIKKIYGRQEKPVFGMIAQPMPETELGIYELIKSFNVVVCYLEKVHAMPKQGVTSMFTFGQGYGFIRGVLSALQIPFVDVHPKTWMKGLGIPLQGKDKLRLLKAAQQMFPKLELWKQPKTKGKQLAVCDAMLIAEFARRTYGGTQ